MDGNSAENAGKTAYDAFCRALGITPYWDTLPDRTKNAWFAVECVCGGDRRSYRFDAFTGALRIDGVPNAPRGAPPASYVREPLPGQNPVSQAMSEILSGPAMDEMRAGAFVRGILGNNASAEDMSVFTRALVTARRLNLDISEPQDRADLIDLHLYLKARGLYPQSRSSIIPAEMEHLNREWMVGGAAIETDADRERAHERIRGGSDHSGPQFDAIVGFPSAMVMDGEMKAAEGVGLHPVKVDCGDHWASGTYVLTAEQFRRMLDGKVCNMHQVSRESATNTAEAISLYLKDVAKKTDLNLTDGLYDPDAPIIRHIEIKGGRAKDYLSKTLDDIIAGMDPPLPMAVDILAQQAAEREAELRQGINTAAETVLSPEAVHGLREEHRTFPSTGEAEAQRESRRFTATDATGMGFTGEMCDNPDCGAFAMLRTGKCSTCQVCFRSSGCG